MCKHKESYEGNELEMKEKEKVDNDFETKTLKSSTDHDQ